MRLRTLYENSMRIILLLISVQFFSLAIHPGEEESSIASSKSHHNLKAEHNKALTLSVFLEERTEKEGENENEDDRAKLVHCVELADLSSSVNALSHVIHSSDNKLIQVGQRFDLQPPLFKLHRIFLI